MVFLLVWICRQWVVDAIPCRRPHAEGSTQLSVLGTQSNQNQVECGQL